MTPITSADGLPAVPKIYRAGTLRYTFGGIAALFVWLLWGDFCFMIFEEIFKRFLPLYMKDLHASNKLIGLMTVSIGSVINVAFLPAIGMASDRRRGRWGRRVPFLFWATPCTVFSLILIGYTTEIGAWLQDVLAFLPWQVSATTVTLGALCVFVAMYHFFNMVMVNLFQWLQRDVVPTELMARFLAFFRLVGTLGTFVFLRYLFPYVIDHRKAVCVGIGLVYLTAFLLMCWRVKEGEYPPPSEEKRAKFGAAFLTYFRDAVSVPLYRNFLIVYAIVTAASSCAMPFVTLFVRETLHLSMDDIGKAFAWGNLAAMITYVPMGYLCDWISPFRVMFWALVCSAIAWALGAFLVHDGTSWMIFWILVAMLPQVAWNLGFNAVTMQLFPAEKFGQFSSGLNVLGFGSGIFSTLLAGQFFDWVESDYQMIFGWAVFWFALALIPMAQVYRGWKQCGGPHQYVPPLPS